MRILRECSPTICNVGCSGSTITGSRNNWQYLHNTWNLCHPNDVTVQGVIELQLPSFILSLQN